MFLRCPTAKTCQAGQQKVQEVEMTEALFPPRHDDGRVEFH
jgi:hypothetical protein